LLELYRDHRDEIDGLTDSAALFVLAYANYVGRITPKALAHQVGLTATTPLSALAPLLRGQMITQQGDVLGVTGFARRVLEDAELTGWTVPTAQPRARPAQLSRVSLDWRRASVASAAVLLFFLVVFSWPSTIQTQLPLEYTPTRPAATAVVTRTPTPVVTLLPSPSPDR
jgi:hypothetical protein